MRPNHELTISAFNYVNLLGFTDSLIVVINLLNSVSVQFYFLGNFILNALDFPH